jgi:hypothetical protein
LREISFEALPIGLVEHCGGSPDGLPAAGSLPAAGCWSDRAGGRFNPDQKSIRIFKQMPSTRHIVKVLLNRPMRPAKNVIAIGQGLTTAT